MSAGDPIIVRSKGPLNGLHGRIVEECDGYVLATVGDDDPRPLRFDEGYFDRIHTAEKE